MTCVRHDRRTTCFATIHVNCAPQLAKKVKARASASASAPSISISKRSGSAMVGVEGTLGDNGGAGAAAAVTPIIVLDDYERSKAKEQVKH